MQDLTILVRMVLSIIIIIFLSLQFIWKLMLKKLEQCPSSNWVTLLYNVIVIHNYINVQCNVCVHICTENIKANACTTTVKYDQ